MSRLGLKGLYGQEVSETLGIPYMLNFEVFFFNILSIQKYFLLLFLSTTPFETPFSHVTSYAVVIHNFTGSDSDDRDR